MRVLRHPIVGRRSDPIRFGSPGQWIRLTQVDTAAAGGAQPGIVVTPGQPQPGTLWRPAVADDGAVTFRSPLRIEHRIGRWRIVDGWGGCAEIDSERILQIESGVPEVSLVTAKDVPYPGILRLVQRGEGSDRSIDVVNHVPLEDYLPGVLAGELYSHWHLHAHAAQAVAARSFAICEQVHYLKRRHYDVTDTHHSQVYRGAKGHERAFEAVDITRGRVLAWDDALVPGYYSSCCGGAAARAVDAIGPNPVNDIPPLHGRAGTDVCTAAPRYSWQIDRRRDVLADRLAAYGRQRGDRDLAGLVNIASIRIDHRNEHGRPTHFLLTDGREAAVEIPAETLRIACNYEGDRRLPSLKQRLHSSNFTVGRIGRNLTFEGHGHGHGVGLCQYGAQTRAEQGQHWTSILAWYYPQAQITAAYA